MVFQPEVISAMALVQIFDLTGVFLSDQAPSWSWIFLTYSPRTRSIPPKHKRVDANNKLTETFLLRSSVCDQKESDREGKKQEEKKTKNVT